MNRIQNHRLTWILTDVVVNINSYLLNLFLDVILNDFNPLNNYVLKDSLSLFYIHIVLYVFIVKPIHHVGLELVVDSIRVVQNGVHVACAHS